MIWFGVGRQARQGGTDRADRQDWTGRLALPLPATTPYPTPPFPHPHLLPPPPPFTFPYPLTPSHSLPHHLPHPTIHSVWLPHLVSSRLVWDSAYFPSVVLPSCLLSQLPVNISPPTTPTILFAFVPLLLPSYFYLLLAPG